MKTRLLFIDGLRGVAASMVVLYHLVGRTTADWLTQYGYLGVTVFFVLSGYVITMSVGDRRISLSFLGRFAARRALRLDPPYWASIFLAVLLALIAARVGMHREMPSLASLGAHLFYLQELTGFPAISQVYWTLCLEVQFYFFLILLLWFGQSFRGFNVAWFAIFGLSLLEQSGVIDIAMRGLFLPHWFAFALGAMAYWVSAGKMRIAGLIGAILATLLFTPFKHADWFITASATAALIHLGAHLNAMERWLAGPAMQFLGRISYSLYLFHPLIGWTAMSVALKYTNQWVALIVGLTVSMVSAWIMYALVERQSVRISRMVKLDVPVLRERTS